MKPKISGSSFITNIHRLVLLSIVLFGHLPQHARSQNGNRGISNIPTIPGCKIFEREEALTYAVRCTMYDAIVTPPYLPPNTSLLEIYAVYDLPINVPLTHNLSHLHELRVVGCKLKNISSTMFLGLSDVRNISLKNNYLKELERGTFIHNHRLEKIDLSGNYILSIASVTMALGELHDLHTIVLSNNMLIRWITNSDFISLTNVNLQILDISRCSITHVEENSFTALAKLSSLDISDNPFDSQCLINISSNLHFTNISELRMNNIRLSSNIPPTFLEVLSTFSIEYLDLSFNRLFPFPYVKYTFSKLKYLDLTYCDIGEVDSGAFHGMKSLETLILKQNQIYTIASDFSPLNKLKTLDLSKPIESGTRERSSVADYRFRNQNELEFLNLDYFPLRQYIRRFSLYGLFSLKTLSMGSCLITGIEDYAFETLISLETLTLRKNSIESVQNNTFYGLKSVKILNLNNNGLSFLNNTHPFDHTPNLETLTINENKISQLPPGLFLKLYNIGLIRARENFIIPWKHQLLPRNENMKSLYLDFSINKITFFTPFMLDDLRQVEHVDFSLNPLNCSACGMLELQTWMIETNTSFLPFRKYDTDVELYACYYPHNLKGLSIVDVEIPQAHCLPIVVNVVLIVVSVLCSVFGCVFFAVVLWHFWSWNIKYCCFRLQLKVRTFRDTTTADSFKYDAFVSHSHSDVAWVRDHLIPALENDEQRSKLCIPDRDFNATLYIMENVLNAVAQSRTTILLLSNGYLDSHWCQFDLDMALHKLFEDTRNGLILVLLGDVDKSKLTKNLKYIMRTRTCIPWTDNPVGQKLFWERLRLAVAKPNEKDILKHIT